MIPLHSNGVWTIGRVATPDVSWGFMLEVATRDSDGRVNDGGRGLDPHAASVLATYLGAMRPEELVGETFWADPVRVKTPQEAIAQLAATAHGHPGLARATQRVARIEPRMQPNGALWGLKLVENEDSRSWTAWIFRTVSGESEFAPGWRSTETVTVRVASPSPRQVARERVTAMIVAYRGAQAPGDVHVFDLPWHEPVTVNYAATLQAMQESGLHVTLSRRVGPGVRRTPDDETIIVHRPLPAPARPSPGRVLAMARAYVKTG